MSAYLYTWNPNNWDWADLSDAIYRVNNGNPYDIRWSCGNNTLIEVGDLFFLMRVGVVPKGIIGCGYIETQRYEHPHWNVERAQRGDKAWRTDLSFRALSETPLFSLEYLKSKFPTHRWTPQSSGTSIPDSIAAKLLKIVQANPSTSFAPSTPEDLRIYAEGRPKTTTVKTYDRDPEARQCCLGLKGYVCTVCGFDFEKSYGAIGKGFIEVHHLKQLADAGADHVINPATDLAPVCANCHRMLHKNRPPYSIEELQAFRRTATNQ